MNDLLLDSYEEIRMVDDHSWNLPIDPDGYTRSICRFIRLDFCPLVYAASLYPQGVWVEIMGNGEYRLHTRSYIPIDENLKNCIEIPKLQEEHKGRGLDYCNFSYVLSNFMILVSKSGILTEDQGDYVWRMLIK